MRILIVDPGFEYSTLAIAQSYCRAFERLGYDVSEYDTGTAYRESLRLLQFHCPGCNKDYKNPKKYSWHQLTEYISSPILNWIIQEKIDVLLTIHGYHTNIGVVDSARRLGCITGLIMTDEPQQVDESCKWSQFYDFVFCNDRNVLKRHKKSHYLPVAANEEIFYPKEVKKEYRSDILVAGSFYKERFEFLEDSDLIKCMKKYKTKFVGARRNNFVDKKLNKFFQHVRANSKRTYEQMADYVAGSKVNIDIPRDEFRDGIFGRSNTKRIQASCLSPRIFESALAGSMVFTNNYRQDIFELFPEDLFPTYNDHSYLIELIEKYLKDEKERKKIVKKQREYCLEHHTYFKRSEEICRIMGIKPSKYIDNAVVSNRITIKRIEKHWVKNSKKLVKHYKPENTLEKFKDKYKDETCCIISNGPSYEEYKPPMINGEIKYRFLLNEANGSYITLDDKHFGVIIHPVEDVYERCIKKLKPTYPLLCSTVVNYKVVEHWAKYQPVYFFHTDLIEQDNIKSKLKEKYNYPVLPPGMSVGYSAITCAIYMGFKKIILFGLDFCYKGMKKYANRKLTYQESSKINFRLMESAWGDPILTDDVLLQSRNNVLNLIVKNPDVEFEIFGGGLLFSDKVENLKINGRC